MVCIRVVQWCGTYLVDRSAAISAAVTLFDQCRGAKISDQVWCFRRAREYILKQLRRNRIEGVDG